MNNKSIIEKAKERLEYYKSLEYKSHASISNRVKVNEYDGLVRRFLNRLRI